eukprot:4073287-Ditylum_brightwellii.AAC.2
MELDLTTNEPVPEMDDSSISDSSDADSLCSIDEIDLDVITNKMKALSLDTPQHIDRVSIMSIHTAQCRQIASSRKAERQKMYSGNENTCPGRIELDSHVDTTCVGRNTVPLYYTGQVCNVMPYNDTYQPVKDVPIGGAATAWTHPQSGHTIIFELHQVLMFCDELDVTLANPNQIRYSGHMVCDDYKDEHRPLSISITATDIEVPLDVDGVIIGFDTRKPTEDELENCPRVILTEDTEWDPRTINLTGDSTQTREYRKLMSGVHIANVCTTSNPNEPQVCRSARTSDITLASISSAYTDLTLLPRLLACISIAHWVVCDGGDRRQNGSNNTAIVGSMLSDTRHSKITPEELARKWNLGLATAKYTLDTTTQHGIRHAVRPLSR